MKILRSILFAIIGGVSLVISFHFYDDSRFYNDTPFYALYDVNAPTRETWLQECRKGNGASISTLQNAMSDVDKNAEKIGKGLTEGLAAFFLINGLVLLTLSIPTNISKARKSEL